MGNLFRKQEEPQEMVVAEAPFEAWQKMYGPGVVVYTPKELELLLENRLYGSKASRPIYERKRYVPGAKKSSYAYRGSPEKSIPVVARKKPKSPTKRGRVDVVDSSAKTPASKSIPVVARKKPKSPPKRGRVVVVDSSAKTVPTIPSSASEVQRLSWLQAPPLPAPYQ